jgi:hypothetical protein
VQTVEGIFFMFGSMAECVDLEETIYLPALMNLVPSIQFNNITLLSTALYMIGKVYRFQSYFMKTLPKTGVMEMVTLMGV